MPDMLVKLYALPEPSLASSKLKEKGIEVRLAHSSEKREIATWVRRHFIDDWAKSCEVALEQKPANCFIAVERERAHHPTANPYDLPAEILLGFACYDVVARGMFGPEGVREDRRGQGIGKALLLACLHRMAAEGYAYTVIGWAGPTGFYERTVGATIIECSEPGIYRGRLKGVV